MSENPDDHDDGEDWNDRRAGEFKRRAIAANIAPVQFQRGETAKNVK